MGVNLTIILTIEIWVETLIYKYFSGIVLATATSLYIVFS